MGWSMTTDAIPSSNFDAACVIYVRKFSGFFELFSGIPIYLCVDPSPLMLVYLPLVLLTL